LSLIGKPLGKPRKPYVVRLLQFAAIQGLIGSKNGIKLSWKKCWTQI